MEMHYPPFSTRQKYEEVSSRGRLRSWENGTVISDVSFGVFIQRNVSERASSTSTPIVVLLRLFQHERISFQRSYLTFPLVIIQPS